MGTNLAQNQNTLTGSNLKLLACTSMLIDHLSLVFGFTGVADLIFRQLIGRLAFPIFAFLLVEGFQHTKNIRKYFAGLLLFALLSEIPYDLTIMGTGSLLPEFTHQNTLFTLCLGLLMLLCIKKAEALLFDRASAYDRISIVRLLVILSFSLIAWLLHLDYGYMGLTCIGAMYIFRTSPLQSAFWGCICLNLEFFSMPGAFLSLLPLSLYNGKRGKQRKYLFYLFYPLHLVLLFALKKLLMPGS